MAGAVPQSRRVPVTAVLGLAAYLLLCPAIFVLAPLAMLLVVSRPGSWREWVALTLTAIWLGITLAEPAGIATQLLPAWAMFLTGSFVGLVLWRPRRFTDAALLAVAISLVITTLGLSLVGLSWQEVQLAAAHDGWQTIRTMLHQGLDRSLGAQRAAGIEWYLNTVGDGVGTAAALFPGLLVLTSLLGLGLAWGWYHRIASNPISARGGSFREFRFSDQLVWGLVLGLLLLVLDTPPRLANVGANLLLVTAGLYIARGVAVAWSTVRRLPSGLVLMLVLGMILLLPVALGLLVSLGLADSWVDFRRRLAPSYLGE